MAEAVIIHKLLLTADHHPSSVLRQLHPLLLLLLLLLVLLLLEHLLLGRLLIACRLQVLLHERLAAALRARAQRAVARLCGSLRCLSLHLGPCWRA